MSNPFSLVLGTILLAGLSNPPASTLATPIYTPLVAGNTTFALNLFAQLIATNSGNVFISPYSISTCFGMVYAGARGETALQMATALNLSTNQAEIGPQFGALQAELESQQDQNVIRLDVANGLWAQTNYPFLPAFLDNASTNFEAGVQQVNFITEAPQITDQINAWVATQTEGMISNLLQPGSLTPATRLTLVDAIYFNGGWQTPFDTNFTTVAPFYVSPNQSVPVPLMEQREWARYYADNLLQAVELPYLNSNLTMVVLLPLGNSPLALTPTELATAIDGLTPQWMDVTLPKFKLETTVNLVPILKNLGMIDAFDAGAADFSGIDGSSDLSIDSAIHKAVVDVSETGTVAAGATVITLPPAFSPIPTLFRADRPFVFLIRDTNSGSIVFLGQVANPVPGAAGTRPLIQANAGSFGLRNQQFGFAVVGTNSTLVVEACTNLEGGMWFPVQTLTLTNGSGFFSEPWLANSPGRFYRVHAY
jgi:serpin B